MKRRDFLKSTVTAGAVFAGLSTDCMLGLFDRPDYGGEVLLNGSNITSSEQGRLLRVRGKTIGLNTESYTEALKLSSGKDFWRDVNRIVGEAEPYESIGMNRAGLDLAIHTAAERWGWDPEDVRALDPLHCDNLRVYEVVMPGRRDVPRAVLVPRFCTFSIASHKGVEFRLVEMGGWEVEWRDNPYLRGEDPDGLFPKFSEVEKFSDENIDWGPIIDCLKAPRDYKSQITDYKLQISDYRLQITNLKY